MKVICGAIKDRREEMNSEKIEIRSTKYQMPNFPCLFFPNSIGNCEEDKFDESKPAIDW